MLTRPRSRRSAIRIRMTPSGRSSSAARSATEACGLQNRSRLTCSGPSPEASSKASSLRAPPRTADTRAIRSILPPVGRVLPAVSAYGRTTRSLSRSACHPARQELKWAMPHLRIDLRGARSHAKVLADSLDEQRHLVGDQSGIRAGCRQDREAASLPGGGHEQKGRLELDDRLQRTAAGEVLAETPREALEPGSHGSQ